jgi:hypothetical protein
MSLKHKLLNICRSERCSKQAWRETKQILGPVHFIMRLGLLKISKNCYDMRMFPNTHIQESAVVLWIHIKQWQFSEHMKITKVFFFVTIKLSFFPPEFISLHAYKYIFNYNILYIPLLV